MTIGQKGKVGKEGKKEKVIHLLKTSCARLLLWKKLSTWTCYSGTLRVMGPNFKPRDVVEVSNLQNLLRDGILREVTVKVEDARKRNFNFKEHGFEYRWLPDNIQETLFQLNQNILDPALRETLRQKLAKFLREAAHVVGLDPSSVIAIPLDAVCRNTDPQQQDKGFTAVPLVHIDFPQDSSRTLRTFQQQWKPRVESALERTLEQEEYESLQVKEMINVWMPLDDTVVSSHLALLPTKPKVQRRLEEYTAKRRNGEGFGAMLMEHKEKDSWFTMPGMQRGQAVFFGSSLTPHTALDLHSSPILPRKSVEVRILFLSNSSAKS